jgi:hypothetical protein
MAPLPSPLRRAAVAAALATLAAACKPTRPATGADAQERPGPAQAPAAAPPSAPPPPASCVDDGAPYGVDELRARVAYLASGKLEGRVPGTDGDRAAREVFLHSFRHPFRG